MPLYISLLKLIEMPPCSSFRPLCSVHLYLPSPSLACSPHSRSLSASLLNDPSHFFQQLKSSRVAAYSSSMAGLDITDFFSQKHVLLTGVTGFLAKVFLEKLLRVQPQVAKVYCLIRAKDIEDARSRMTKEVFGTDLFNKLLGLYGTHFHDFTSEKVCVVVGDLCHANLGLEPTVAQQLRQSINIIVNCSAATAFDERYDIALDINTIAPQRIITFAKQCGHLQVFLQVSTAYVNGKKAGEIHESSALNTDTNGERFPNINVEVESKMVKQAIEHFKIQNLGGGDELSGILKDLGKERAKTFGWRDTYTFTKALGEMAINSLRGDLPVVILRPTIIESTLAEPFPGWIQKNRVIDKVLVMYGRGQLTSFPVHEKLVLDVVPADMVVNSMLAAITKHAKQRGFQIYHVSSSTANPLQPRTIAGVVSRSFISKPYVNGAGKAIKVDKLQLVHSMQRFKQFLFVYCFIPILVIGLFQWVTGVKRYNEIQSIIHSFKRLLYLVDQYEPYVFFRGRFNNSNIQSLFEELSNEEKEKFPFDVRCINWSDYFEKVHIPSLRKYIMKEKW